MNFNVDAESVIPELDNIDKSIDELRTILSNLESDISRGWSSDRSKSVVTPKIEEVSKSINTMQECTNHLRSNVVQYLSNVDAADSAGSITGSSEAKG